MADLTHGAIRWKYPKSPVGPEEIARVEAAFGVELPADYAAVAIAHPGARPRPNRFDTSKRKGARLKTFLSLSDKDAGNILQIKEWLGDRLMGRMVPFASDDGGNYVCFHDLNPPLQPIVVLWNHEQPAQYEFIASSFREFIQSLY